MMSLTKILIIVLICFFFSLIITPIIKKIAFHIGALDYPDHGRKIHEEPIPDIGGLSIFFGFLLGYMLFSKQTPEMISILIGSFIIIFVGFIDDMKSIKARYKLVGQILAALVITCYGNILLTKISAFGFYIAFPPYISYPLTVCFIVVIINSINLIDGLDGLASGVSSIFFLTIGIIAAVQNKMGGLDAVLAFIMLGSTLGFLVHNFYPAKIFLGDTGSMFLGFIISVIALLGFKNITLTSFITPLLLLAIPLLDTIFAMVRRFLKGESITKPDKLHIQHQLLNMKFSHRSTVLVIYLMNILFAIASIIYVIQDRYLGIYIYSFLLIVVVWFITHTTVVVDKDYMKKKNRKKHP